MRGSLRDLNELCPICGDNVSGYHYGPLTCESCKGFFKRTVQNHKHYKCNAGNPNHCEINIQNRKRCPSCRFNKCLDKGMQLNAVRENRFRGGRNSLSGMYKNDREARMQRLRSQESGANVVPLPALADIAPFPVPPVPNYFSPLSIKTEPDSPPAPDMPSPSFHMNNSFVPNMFSPAPSHASPYDQYWNYTDALNRANNYTHPAPPTVPTYSTPFMLPQCPVPTVSTVAQYYSAVMNELCNTLPEDECIHQLIDLSKGVNQNPLSFAVLVGEKNILEIVRWVKTNQNFLNLKTDDRMSLLQFNWATVHLVDFTFAMVHGYIQESYQTACGDTVSTEYIALLGCLDQIPDWNRLVARLSRGFDKYDYVAFRFLAIFDSTVVNDDLVTSMRQQVIYHWGLHKHITDHLNTLDELRKIATNCIKYIRDVSIASPHLLPNSTADNSMVIEMAQSPTMDFLDAKPEFAYHELSGTN